MFRQRIQTTTQIVGSITILALAVYGVLAFFGFNGTILASAETAAATSGAPTLMNYQGTLKDSDNNLLHGEYNMTFCIYDDPTEGTELWSEAHTKVSVVQGGFSVLLGDTTPLTADLFSSAERYIGVTVADYGEMSPRGRIASVAYALTATESSKADLAGRAYKLSAPDDDPLNAVYVTNDGKVGIGTTDPKQKLSVMGRIRAAVDAAQTEYVEIRHGGGNGIINTAGDGDLEFRHDGATKMSLTDTGDLHVDGDISWGGDLESFTISETYHADRNDPGGASVAVMTPSNNSVCFLTKVYDHSLANTYAECRIDIFIDKWVLYAINHASYTDLDIQCEAVCLSW